MTGTHRRYADQDLIALSVAAERRRVLTELHDVLGQELTLLALECDLVLAADADGPCAQGLRQIRQRAHELIRSAAVLAQGVKPVSLRDRLERAVRDLGLAGIEFRLDLPPRALRLPRETDAFLGCVVREGVTNILRHAPAVTRCDISIETTDGLVLAIRNDGASDRRPSRPGMGITGLRERAAALGACVEVMASAGTFVLAAHLPAVHAAPAAQAAPAAPVRQPVQREPQGSSWSGFRS